MPLFTEEVASSRILRELILGVILVRVDIANKVDGAKPLQLLVKIIKHEANVHIPRLGELLLICEALYVFLGLIGMMLGTILQQIVESLVGTIIEAFFLLVSHLQYVFKLVPKLVRLYDLAAIAIPTDDDSADFVVQSHDVPEVVADTATIPVGLSFHPHAFELTFKILQPKGDVKRVFQTILRMQIPPAHRFEAEVQATRDVLRSSGARVSEAPADAGTNLIARV